MDLAGRVIVVTGGANGIGAAMCRRFAAEEARGIVVADLDGDAAATVAAEVGGVATRTDVASEADVLSMVAIAEETYGPVDLLCLNAGIPTGGGVDAPNDAWQRTWDVNVMSHVYAVRAVLPSMLNRGEGYLLHTASAAGLLTNLGAAPYSVTKHAVLALAEWLSVTHGDAGIRVSALCPQFVRTGMLDSLTELGDGFHDMAVATSITADEVAEAVVAGIRDERFLILPHPEVAGYFAGKANDYERWLRGMRRLQDQLGAGPAEARVPNTGVVAFSTLERAHTKEGILVADTPKAYAIDAAEGVVVSVDDSSDDETFQIVVVKEGEEVEKHEAVTADSVGGLESDHFSVEYIDPPAPAAEWRSPSHPGLGE